MEVTCVHEGLWRWSVPAPDGGAEMASAYIEHGDVMLLVDPALPAPGDDLDRFQRAIDHDVARLGGPVHVMLTRADQPRDAGALARMTGGAIWTLGDPLPPGMRAVPTGREGEVALWSGPHAALMPGRALVVRGNALHVMPGADGPALLALATGVVIPSLGPMADAGAGPAAGPSP